MDTREAIIERLEACHFKVSTDTRKDVSGSVYFALRGETFDGNIFVRDALDKGALAAVTDNPENVGDAMYFVPNVLDALQTVAHAYRKKFSIPILAIGGSNGKSTSKDLTRAVLATRYKVHATEGSFNNHFGVPLSILSMPLDTEIGVFEIGASHPGEHADLLKILEPTHVVVTNNGMDHLEGFGTPEGSRKANKEIYDWALTHSVTAFVDSELPDIVADSKENIRILYPENIFEINQTSAVTVVWDEKEYTTHLVGKYNLKNIYLAVAIGKYFGIDTHAALSAITDYIPLSKRSQKMEKNGVTYIIDCYNANPTSMLLSLESFIDSTPHPRGVILGDMLELGEYSATEHEKIVEYVARQKLDCVVFIGAMFGRALETTMQNKTLPHVWFPDAATARVWWASQNFTGYTFLLKGSRGSKVEKVIES